MERDLRGSLTRETESKTQATNQLIMKSPSENKICSPHPPQDEKKINETSNVDIDTTLTGGFATEAVIMPFGSMDLKCRDKWGQVEKDEIKTKSCEVIGAINETFHKKRVNSSHTKLPLLSCCWHSFFFSRYRSSRPETVLYLTELQKWTTVFNGSRIQGVKTILIRENVICAKKEERYHFLGRRLSRIQQLSKCSELL